MSQQTAVAEVEVLPTAKISAWDVCLAIIPLLACMPLLVGQAITLWQSGYSQIGLFMWLLLGAVLVWRARGQVTRHAGRIYVALVLYAFAVGALVFGLLHWSFNWGQLAASLFLIAWGLGRCSQRNWHEVVSWGLLFVLTLPSTLVYQDLDRWLSDTAAGFASATLDAHGILHHLEEFRLSLATGVISVTSTGSAKLSLYAVVCLTALWCWLCSRSFLHSVTVLLSGLLCLVVSRFAAILVVSWGMLEYQQDWTLPGNEHYALAASEFVLTMLLVLLLDQTLTRFLAPIPSTHPEYFTLFAAANNLQTWPKPKLLEDEDDSEEMVAVRQRIEGWRLSWFCLDWRKSTVCKATVYCLAGLCTATIIPSMIAVLRGGLVEWPEPAAQLHLEPFRSSLTAALLPAAEGEFKQIRFEFGPVPTESGKESTDSETATGVVDARWIYQWQGYSVLISLSAPQSAWRVPFEERVSRSMKRIVVLKADGIDSSWPWYYCRQINSLGGDFYLFQCGLNDDLSPTMLDANPSNVSWLYFDKLQGKSQESKIALYDVRLSCESGGTLPIEQLETLQTFFRSIRGSLQKQLEPNQLGRNYVKPSLRNEK